MLFDNETVSCGHEMTSTVAADASCFQGPEYSSNCNGSHNEEGASRLSLGCEDCRRFDSEASQPPSSRRKDSSLYYDMSGNKILIIFNHFTFKKTKNHRKSVLKARDGTYEDVKNLEKTFRQLGFMVITHDDWKYRDIMKYLTEVCKKDHSDTSCVAVAVMSHGKGARVSAADRRYPVANITDKLRTAPSLAGKPKLFFIQACRVGHTLPNPRQDELSLDADCLLLYSTYEDQYAYRDAGGSWLVGALCEVLAAHHASLPLAQMMTLVNRRVATRACKYGKQTPLTEYTLKKFLIL